MGAWGPSRGPLLLRRCDDRSTRLPSPFPCPLHACPKHQAGKKGNARPPQTLNICGIDPARSAVLEAERDARPQAAAAAASAPAKAKTARGGKGSFPPSSFNAPPKTAPNAPPFIASAAEPIRSPAPEGPSLFIGGEAIMDAADCEVLVAPALVASCKAAPVSVLVAPPPPARLTEGGALAAGLLLHGACAPLRFFMREFAAFTPAAKSAVWQADALRMGGGCRRRLRHWPGPLLSVRAVPPHGQRPRGLQRTPHPFPPPHAFAV